MWQQNFGLDISTETREKCFSFQGCLILIPALLWSEELFSRSPVYRLHFPTYVLIQLFFSFKTCLLRGKSANLYSLTVKLPYQVEQILKLKFMSL